MNQAQFPVDDVSSDWAAKAGQERILAIQLPRSFFDELLRSAVPSSYDSSRYAGHEDWKHQVSASVVRFQWDPAEGVEHAEESLGIVGFYENGEEKIPAE